ncbi:MAG TPA: GDSL-type esterase/lipase family protein [Tepidisphaeraceae bacterium]|nr:GDSL-type esterase/lipase family protein [Tepidisphaeraceae bacterium]
MKRALWMGCVMLAAVFALPFLANAARTEQSAVTPEKGNDARQKQFIERGKDKNIKLVFLGDSITDFWMNRGKKVWDEYYTKYDAADFGVSGEHTEHVLGRIDHGLLDDVRPKVVVIMIGTNNIGHYADEKPEWVAEGVKKIVETVHQKLPEAKVLLLGVFPRDGKDSSSRKKVEEINAIISKLDDGKTTRYLDIGSKFLDEKGELPKDIMPDKLHPTEKGYKIWAEAMQPLLDEMMK